MCGGLSTSAVGGVLVLPLRSRKVFVVTDRQNADLGDRTLIAAVLCAHGNNTNVAVSSRVDIGNSSELPLQRREIFVLQQDHGSDCHVVSLLCPLHGCAGQTNRGSTTSSRAAACIAGQSARLTTCSRECGPGLVLESQ